MHRSRHEFRASSLEHGCRTKGPEPRRSGTLTDLDDVRGTTRRYRLYGEVLETSSDRFLRAPLTDDPPSVVLSVTSERPVAQWKEAIELHATPIAPGRHEPDFRFFSLPDRDVIRIEGSADFHLLDDRIICHLLDESEAYLVEIVLAGLAFAFWLERRGVLTLHGAAASFDGAGAAFLANSGMGKSSVATFMTMSGDPLITEDLLVVGLDGQEAPVVHSGLAQLRLWPEQAARVHEDWQSLEQPHPRFEKRKVPIGPDGIGSLAAGASPLRRIYLLRRLVAETGDPTTVQLPAAEAMAALLQNSYLPEISARFGWHARRMSQLADLLQAVDVSVLYYPTGFHHLDAVRALVRSDLGLSA